MKITDPITSIDIKIETLSSHDTYDSCQRCDSPRFVPSDSVPFSLRQSLLELHMCDFVNFDLTSPCKNYKPHTYKLHTPNFLTNDLHCIISTRNPSRHRQASFDLHNGCLHGPESYHQVGVQVREEEEGLQVYVRRRRTINCKSC